MSRFSGFIPGLGKQGGKKAKEHRRGDAAGSSLQPTGENAQQPLFVHGLPDTFGQGAAKACQRHGGSCTAPLNQRLVEPKTAQNNASYHIENQNSGRGELRFVDQNLTDQAQCAAQKKCFQIFHWLNPPW